MLQAGVLPFNASGRGEKGSLHLCSQAKHQGAEIARVLIHRGADVNDRDFLGHTPLYDAVSPFTLHLELIKVLTEAGADVSLKNNVKHDMDYGLTALHSVNHPEAAKILIECGASLTEKSPQGVLPLGHVLLRACQQASLMNVPLRVKSLVEAANVMITNGSPTSKLSKSGPVKNVTEVACRYGWLELLT